MKKNKRPQTPKSRNLPLAKAMQELRQSSAATPHVNRTKYNRNDKSWKRDIKW